MTYFVQPCRTCGRSLQIRLQYLGKKVVCRHCQGEMIAWDPDESPDGVESAVPDPLARAEALLRTFLDRESATLPEQY